MAFFISMFAYTMDGVEEKGEEQFFPLSDQQADESASTGQVDLDRTCDFNSTAHDNIFSSYALWQAYQAELKKELNFKKAFEFLKKSAEGGLPKAQHELYLMYSIKTKESAPNSEEAKKWADVLKAKGCPVPDMPKFLV